MALTKEDLQQINTLIKDGVAPLSTLMLSVQEDISQLRIQISQISDELADIKIRLDRLHKATTQDIIAAYQDIETLKKRVTKLERMLAKLK